jgi:hypothetical protein
MLSVIMPNVMAPQRFGSQLFLLLIFLLRTLNLTALNKQTKNVMYWSKFFIPSLPVQAAVAGLEPLMFASVNIL